VETEVVPALYREFRVESAILSRHAGSKKKGREQEERKT
jgi:hypothetical protein